MGKFSVLFELWGFLRGRGRTPAFYNKGVRLVWVTATRERGYKSTLGIVANIEVMSTHFSHRSWGRQVKYP